MSVFPQDIQAVTSERDILKGKLKKTESELEQIQGENQGFREERDRLRRKVDVTDLFLLEKMKKICKTVDKNL